MLECLLWGDRAVLTGQSKEYPAPENNTSGGASTGCLFFYVLLLYSANFVFEHTDYLVAHGFLAVWLK
jgi:hypothetical protein